MYGFSSVWMRRCLFKLPFRLNDLLHCWQMYFLTVLWVCLWLKKLSRLANVFGHSSQDSCLDIFNCQSTPFCCLPVTVIKHGGRKIFYQPTTFPFADVPVFDLRSPFPAYDSPYNGGNTIPAGKSNPIQLFLLWWLPICPVHLASWNSWTYQLILVILFCRLICKATQPKIRPKALNFWLGFSVSYFILGHPVYIIHNISDITYYVS